MELEPRKPTVTGPPDWFTGDVYIDVVAQGHGSSPLTVGLVHFTPGARTAWHSHALGQTLYVTEGQGRVQTRGEPVVSIGPGDVVFTPADEWHWHGAAADHLMTHLAVSEGAVEWGDHVTDAEYEGSA
jgi:quercetin dioxygenase-like cupin family protein